MVRLGKVRFPGKAQFAFVSPNCVKAIASPIKTVKEYFFSTEIVMNVNFGRILLPDADKGIGCGNRCLVFRIEILADRKLAQVGCAQKVTVIAQPFQERFLIGRKIRRCGEKQGTVLIDVDVALDDGDAAVIVRSSVVEKVLTWLAEISLTFDDDRIAYVLAVQVSREPTWFGKRAVFPDVCQFVTKKSQDGRSAVEGLHRQGKNRRFPAIGYDVELHFMIS